MKGLTTPLSCWLRGSCLFVQVLGDLCVTSYWIDTLVLKNCGKYLRYSAASSLPLRGKPMQAQGIARRISGTVAGDSTQKVNIPSTHHIPYLSHYIICHLPLVFLSPTSPLPFYSPSLSILPLFLYLPLFRLLLVCSYG